MKRRKFIVAIAILTLSLSFVGCQKSRGDENKPDNVKQETSAQNNENKDNNAEDINKTDESKDASGNEEVVVYTYDIDSEKLIANTVSVEEKTPETVFEQLKELDVITEDAILNSYDISEADGLATGFIDVSKEFINPNLGSTAESLMLDSVVRTFIENTEVKQILLTVDGGDYESGHIQLGAGDFLTVNTDEYGNSNESESDNE